MTADQTGYGYGMNKEINVEKIPFIIKIITVELLIIITLAFIILGVNL